MRELTKKIARKLPKKTRGEKFLKLLVFEEVF